MMREKRVIDKKNGTGMIKVIFLIIVLFTVSYFLYTNYFGKNSEENEVIIIENESFLSGFEVVNDEVHIYCEVSLKNNNSDTKKVRLIGEFQNEVENELLKEGELEACFMEDMTNNIIIEGDSVLKHIRIDFVGEYARNPHMSNRLLPTIEIVEIE